MLFKPVHPVSPIHPELAHPHGHIAPPPPHHGPAARHGMVSVVFESDKMLETFGDSWPFQAEKIAAESPEMKIIFALEMNFKVTVNQQVMESLVFFRGEPAYKFANPVLDEQLVAGLSEKLGIDTDALTTILEHTPDGVVAVIAAKAKK